VGDREPRGPGCRCDARAEVTATQPTTVAGAIALINCYLEIWSEHPIRAEHQASGALKVLRSFLRSISE
jgi:hypothetical protein